CQVERPRLIVGLASAGADLLVDLLNLFQRQMLAVLQLRITAVKYANVFEDFAVRHFPVRSFDEAKLVDAGKARETGNQPDVRTFRRLNRTNSAIVGRVNVADFESGTLARQAARSQRRE